MGVSPSDTMLLGSHFGLGSNFGFVGGSTFAFLGGASEADPLARDDADSTLESLRPGGDLGRCSATFAGSAC